MLSSILSSWFSFVTLPTHITLLRIILVPFIIWSMMIHSWVLANALFIVAAVSDVLDGVLARFLNKVTFAGSFLDSLADKILLLSSYVGVALLMTFKTFSIPFWFLAFVFINELILVIFSCYWGIMRKSLVIKPTRLGRMTSFSQILFIGWLFLCRFSAAEPAILFYVLLVLIVYARSCAFIDYALRALLKEGTF